MSYQNHIEKLLFRLPHKLQIQYALECADDIKHLMNEESLKCLEVTKLWLQGRATFEQINKTATNARNTDTDARIIQPLMTERCARAAANTAWAITDTYPVPSIVIVIDSVAQALGVNLSVYDEKLIKFIKNLNEVERIVYNIKGL